MDKKLFDLLSKPQPTPNEIQQLHRFMSLKYFKPLITPLPIPQIIQNLSLLQWGPQTIICQEGQKIDSYFFLLEGSVNVYRIVSTNQDQSNLEIVKNINEPTIISDSIFTHSPHRLHTVITSDNPQGCKGFVISRTVIEQYCSSLIKEYKILREYFCNFLNLSSDKFYKINLYENTAFRTIKYGQNVKIDNQILVIYSGECLMNFQQKIEGNRRNESPFRVKQIKSMNYRPLLKLCQNECFGMEQIFQENTNSEKFRYIVTSQKLVCISIPIKNIQFFPKQMADKLKYIHDSHLEKLENNIFIKNFRELRNTSDDGLNSKSLSPIFKQKFSPVRHTVKPQGSKGFSPDLKQTSPKCFELPVHKIQSSPNHKRSKSRFRLPNIKSGPQKLQGALTASISTLNRSDVNVQKIPFRDSSINMSDLLDMRKKYCVGFDLKTKCDAEQEHSKQLGRPKQPIKQPRGYFPVAKSRIHKQNNSTHEQRVNKLQTQHKEWSCYVKLPKLI